MHFAEVCVLDPELISTLRFTENTDEMSQTVRIGFREPISLPYFAATHAKVLFLNLIRKVDTGVQKGAVMCPLAAVGWERNLRAAESTADRDGASPRGFALRDVEVVDERA